MRARADGARPRDNERQVLRGELALALVEDKLFTEPDGSDGEAIGLDTADAAHLWYEFLARLRTLRLAATPDAPAREHLLALLCGGDPTRDEAARDWPFLPDDTIAARSGDPADGRFRVDLINELLQILALRHLEELRAWLRPLPWRDVKRWNVHRPRFSRSLARHEIAPIALELSFTCMRLRLRATRYFTIGPDADRARVRNAAHAAAVLRAPRRSASM